MKWSVSVYTIMAWKVSPLPLTYIQKLEYIHFNIEQILVTSEVTHFYRNQSKAVFQVVLKYYKINVAQEN